MMRRAILIAAFAALLTACSGDGDYDLGEIQQLRDEKDAAFREGDASPITIEQRTSFKGLQYFEPDADYVVLATFAESTSTDTIQLQTSTTEVRKAVRAGRFSFRLQGKDLKLWAYNFVDDQGDNSYFVPFTDKTTGHETYYGGRYLDIPVTEDNDYVLDFNMAYNPYCAYSENFSCPLVPDENSLSVAIRAGEKK